MIKKDSELVVMWMFEGCSQRVILSSFLLGVEGMSQAEADQRLFESNFTLFYFGGSSGRGGVFDDEVEGIDYLPPFGTHRKGFQGKVTFQGSGTQSAFFLS